MPSDHDNLPASSAVAAARASLLRRFSWHGGHADIWRVFTEAESLAAVIDGLADPWRRSGITHVIGIESRGFLLGAAVAVNVGAGFHAIRKEEGMLPGPKVTQVSLADYRGRKHLLRMQSGLREQDVVLLVDDWAERGSQATAARQLVESNGATFAGVSLLVDQLEDEVRAQLGRVTSLVRADELGGPDGN